MEQRVAGLRAFLERTFEKDEIRFIVLFSYFRLVGVQEWQGKTWEHWQFGCTEGDTISEVVFAAPAVSTHIQFCPWKSEKPERHLVMSITQLLEYVQANQDKSNFEDYIYAADLYPDVRPSHFYAQVYTTETLPEFRFVTTAADCGHQPPLEQAASQSPQ